MTPLRTLFLFFAFLGLSSIVAEESFNIYAPSRTTNQLWMIEAKPSQDGLALEVAEKLELGFPASTIVSHPAKPLLYVS
ncbi:MAG: hypothetical protein AAGH89_13425, partial [Verrucomicrobiota bacterium]